MRPKLLLQDQLAAFESRSLLWCTKKSGKDSCNKNALIACLKIKLEMRRRLILYETGFPLQTFFTSYFIDGRVFLRIFTFYIVFDDDWGHIYKYTNINSREVTSLSESKNVINMARHFNHRWKQTACLSQDLFAYNASLTPDQFIASPSKFPLKYSVVPK